MSLQLTQGDENGRLAFDSAPAGAAYYSPALPALGSLPRMITVPQGTTPAGKLECVFDRAVACPVRRGACAQPGELLVSAVPREPRARAKPSDESEAP